MGYIRKHAIIVTAFDAIDATVARQKAIGIFKNEEGCIGDKFGRMISDIMQAPINDEYTFFIGPDGSKEGWDTSDKADAMRNEFTSWLNKNGYSFAEVMYDDGDRSTWVRTNYGMASADRYFLENEGD